VRVEPLTAAQEAQAVELLTAPCSLPHFGGNGRLGGRHDGPASTAARYGPFWRPFWRPFWHPFCSPVRTGSPRRRKSACTLRDSASSYSTRQGGRKKKLRDSWRSCWLRGARRACRRRGRACPDGRTRPRRDTGDLTFAGIDGLMDDHANGGGRL
jgi:hypothetical protein